MSSAQSSAQPTETKALPIALTSGDPEESLGLLLVSRDCPAAFSSATSHRFELNSRGDRVTGRLLIPDDRSEPCPLIVIQGDAGAGCNSASLDFAGSWLHEGFALATLDLPLHGERSSPKFSERLLEAIETVRGNSTSNVPLDANGKALLLEFTQQAVCDLSRTLDGLAALPAIDDQRIGIMGLGHGAAIAAIFASLDLRTRAVALAHCSAIGLPEIDPVQFVGNIGPRSVLFLESSQASSKQASDSDTALFDACAEPKRRSPSEFENGTLGSAAAETARAFFSDLLTAS